MDRSVLDLVCNETFEPADFTIRKDGVCRLNSQLAKQLVSRLASDLEDAKHALPR